MRLFCLFLLFRFQRLPLFFLYLINARSVARWKWKVFASGVKFFAFVPTTDQKKIGMLKSHEKKMRRNHGWLINLTRPKSGETGATRRGGKFSRCRGENSQDEGKGSSRFECSWQAAPVAAAEVSTVNATASVAGKPPLDISLATMLSRKCEKPSWEGCGAWKMPVNGLQTPAVALCILFCDCI